MKFIRKFFSHFLVFTIAVTTLTIWLFFAGVLSRYIQYFIWAFLVILIYLRALTGSEPEIQEQDESFKIIKR